MKELQYPFDSNYILLKKKSLKRKLLENNNSFVDKNIAILGGYTTNDIKLVLELFLLDQGIRPSFYESEYNQFYQDAMFPNNVLEKFKPDVIYICTSNRNIEKYPSINDCENDINSLLNSEINKYSEMWNHLYQTYHCPIIQNNFEMPLYRVLGNKDAYDIHGKVNYINRLNNYMYEYAGEHSNFYICDINYISADYGLKQWSDPFYYHMYKYALNVNAIPYLSFNVSNIIKSIFGKNKKGYVLDLDNTLWGGVIGDDGVENIKLGPEESQGQVYSEFQKYLKEQSTLGILLNIDSKNDEKNAIAGLNHPYSMLKEDDFISIKANWDPKDHNFKNIANEIGILPESLVFVDDNPAERYIVEQQLKDVIAPEIGESYQYIYNLDRGGYFEVTSLSDDDKKRNEMYKENAKRTALMNTFVDYKDYLLSLDMNAVIKPFEELYYSRITQLTNKSNQFNLTTKRYTEDEIKDISNNNEYITQYGKLIDRFGDNGIVSIAIGHKNNDECHIDLWLMSCRVLKRDMEYAMMDSFVKQCINQEITKIYGYYYPTAKNSMVKDFYYHHGFAKIEEDKFGNSKWLLIVNEYINKNKVIKVED